LKSLTAGRYVLRIEARQGRAGASRTVAFTIAQAQPSFTQEHSPELDAALAAAARYIDQYEQRISAIGAEEEYEQGVQTVGGGMTTADLLARRAVPATTSMTRKTRANVMTISLGARG